MYTSIRLHILSSNKSVCDFSNFLSNSKSSKQFIKNIQNPLIIAIFFSFFFFFWNFLQEEKV